MRKLNDFEQRNIDFLFEHDIRHAEVCITSNILAHSIFDANKSIMELLKEKSIHDYNAQAFGKEHRVLKTTYILTFKRIIEASTSLYRAKTRGDERMWLGHEIITITEPNDIYSIFVFDHNIFAINITKIDIGKCYRSSLDNPIKSTIVCYK